MSDLPHARAIIWRKAMILSHHLIHHIRQDPFDDDGFLSTGFDQKLRDAITFLLDSENDVQDLGAQRIEQLWTEVPELHVRL